ncbi:mannose-P-dolichol utilization defect 1 protein-like [Salmo trutta]|uniref:mannose-P-dolichol utilization defect 1 protein-like n=1 Tax=Salmo trutta TaxID=8032 RepID=UPI00113076B6|nr:mannose-P-dolichol utilization defect 1 protein-like [Salmo trutta]
MLKNAEDLIHRCPQLCQLVMVFANYHTSGSIVYCNEEAGSQEAGAVEHSSLQFRSESGISWWSVLLQVYAITEPGQRLFMSIQSLAMSFLIQHYSSNTLKRVLLILAYSGVMLLLTSPLVHKHFISTTQASSTLAVVASRV